MSGLRLFQFLDQDAPAQVGKDQEMKVLKEMNDLEQEHDQYVENLKADRSGD